jgi:hypothetical protein
MKTATAAAAATLALSAVAVQGFVLPVMPSSSSRHLLRRPLASVRLTQDVEVLQSVGLAPEMQGSSSTNLDLESSPLALESATLSLDPASGEKRVKRKGPPPPVVVAAGDLLESTWVHRLHVATHYLVTLVVLLHDINLPALYHPVRKGSRATRLVSIGKRVWNIARLWGGSWAGGPAAGGAGGAAGF